MEYLYIFELWFSLGICPGVHLLGHMVALHNAGLEEVQAGIKIDQEISITSNMQITPPLWQKVKMN